MSAVGEAAAGKASRSLAQHIPGQAGIEGMKVAASGAVGELARARIALDERGQRLGELEERTALMMTSAETFSKHAHEVKTRFIKSKMFFIILVKRKRLRNIVENKVKIMIQSRSIKYILFDHLSIWKYYRINISVLYFQINKLTVTVKPMPKEFT